MRNSDLIIRTQRMLPEVYSDESRDFQVFTKLMDAVYNSCAYNAEGIRFISDPQLVNSALLDLFADKLGIDIADSDIMTDEELRFVLCCLATLMKYKGSVLAVYGLVNIFFKIFHISGTYELDISTGPVIVQNTKLSERTIILGLETTIETTKMLYVLAKYLLPPGYAFFVYFYSSMGMKLSSTPLENITLLFRSTNLGVEIAQEIPDFIRDSKYSWEDGTAAVDARVSQLISAVDASQIASIVTDSSRTKFAGFATKDDLNTISNNYSTAVPFDPDPEKKYSQFDVAIFTEGQNVVHKVYIITTALGKAVVDTSAYWCTLENGTLIIVGNPIDLSSDTSDRTGDIYYSELKTESGVTSLTWNKLNFCGTYTLNNYTYADRTKALPATAEKWDYCCIATPQKPFLYSSGTETELLTEPASYKFPILTKQNTLFYSLKNAKYFVSTRDITTQILNPETFVGGGASGNITFLREDDTDYFIVDGVANQPVNFNLLQTGTTLTLEANKRYLLAGCPLHNFSLTGLKLVVEDSDVVLGTDEGNGTIFTTTTATTTATLIVKADIGTSVTQEILQPILIDVTEIISEGQTIDDFIETLWGTGVNEGPIYSEQNQLRGYSLTDNTVYWRRGGNYYICKGQSPQTNTPLWDEYTEPLFLTKLILSKGTV